MSLATFIARNSSLPPSDVQEWTGPIEDIESSVLFVLATWSGPSVMAFKRLTAHLASHPQSPTLLVCDIDLLSAEVRKQLDIRRGVGETFWIRKGQVVASIRDFTRDGWSESVDRNNEMLRLPSS